MQENLKNSIICFSHHSCCMCVNFIHEWRDLEFKVDFERQIFEKFSNGNLITHRVFARQLLRGSCRRNTFSYFVLSKISEQGVRTPISRLIYQYIRIAIFGRKYYIHTYIIRHYNSSVRIIDLISHTTYVVCANFYT